MNREADSSAVYNAAIGLIGLIAAAVNIYKFGSEHETVNLVFALISFGAFAVILGLVIAKWTRK